MSDPIVRRESAVEYFKDLVEAALARQRMCAGERTSYYVVNLLAGFLQRRAEEHDEPLAFRFVRALESSGVRQRAGLREVADTSLLVSGLFADSLRRKLVDVDYYVSIGESAYTALSRFEADGLAPVFGELAENFVRFVDVLSEVSERTSCTSNADLLRLYEKWLKTGSRRSGQLLIERGVMPNATVRVSRIQ